MCIRDSGIGMSGLAKIMKIKGYDVKGADLTRGYVTEELESCLLYTSWCNDLSAVLTGGLVKLYYR